MDGVPASTRAFLDAEDAASAISRPFAGEAPRLAFPARPLPADTERPAEDLGPAQPQAPDPDGQRLLAPPPETVVVPSRRHAPHAREQAWAREAVPCAEHAAEVARLAEALRGAKRAHAMEIERLRAQHASEVRRLIEALWQAQDAARAASVPASPACTADKPAPEPRPNRMSLLRACAGRILCRIEPPLHAASGMPARVARRWPDLFRAWR